MASFECHNKVFSATLLEVSKCLECLEEYYGSAKFFKGWPVEQGPILPILHIYYDLIHHSR